MVELPKAVHRVVSRGREYFYFQPGRGTPHQGKRIRLPSDPQAPEFWQAIRQAQGPLGAVASDTVAAAIDAFLTAPAFTDAITKGTQEIYRRELAVARAAWGTLPAAGLRPMHVQALMDGLASRPGKANNLLGSLRSLSKWARTRGDPFGQSITEGVKPYPAMTGHKPWTPEQIRCAHEKLTGSVRRAVMLGLYTGQRGSDIVRLGWTDVDDGGFRVRQKKTGREVWCPIVPELAAEMATWERRPGPFVTQEDGSVYRGAKLFSKHFAAERAKHSALAGASLHGLRSTAVVRLRREGLSVAQIEDVVGLSMAMIARYCRFADKKTSGQAALLHLRTRAEQNCKTAGKLENRKQGKSDA